MKGLPGSYLISRTADALNKKRQIPTTREILEDRIELLREDLFFVY